MTYITVNQSNVFHVVRTIFGFKVIFLIEKYLIKILKPSGQSVSLEFFHLEVNLHIEYRYNNNN